MGGETFIVLGDGGMEAFFFPHLLLVFGELLLTKETEKCQILFKSGALMQDGRQPSRDKTTFSLVMSIAGENRGMSLRIFSCFFQRKGKR